MKIVKINKASRSSQGICHPIRPPSNGLTVNGNGRDSTRSAPTILPRTRGRTNQSIAIGILSSRLSLWYKEIITNCKIRIVTTAKSSSSLLLAPGPKWPEINATTSPIIAYAIGISIPITVGKSRSSCLVRNLAIATNMVAKIPALSRMRGEEENNRLQTITEPSTKKRTSRTIVGRCETSVVYNSESSSVAVSSLLFLRFCCNSSLLGS